MVPTIAGERELFRFDKRKENQGDRWLFARIAAIRCRRIHGFARPAGIGLENLPAGVCDQLLTERALKPTRSRQQFTRLITRFRETIFRLRALRLKAGQEVYAEAGKMLYKTPSINWETRMQGDSIGQKIWGAVKRKLMGESLFMTYFRATSDGEVGFAAELSRADSGVRPRPRARPCLCSATVSLFAQTLCS